MRLAIVIPGFQANSADWCIPAFTNLARELAKTIEVHVFTLRYPHARQSYQEGSVYVHALGGGAFQGRRLFGLSLLSLWRDTLHTIIAFHNRDPFDAIIGIWATESGWLATRAASRLGIPSLVHLAGGELVWLPDIGYGTGPRSLPKAMVKVALKNASLVTVPSSPIEKALLNSRLRGSLSIGRWALGVDTEMFAHLHHIPISCSQRPFTFICVGSLIPVKGHEALLHAFARLHRADRECTAKLQIVGIGPLDPKLRRLTSELGLNGYVDFLGEVVHNELPDLYRAADCFVIASRHEAQCMAALEAMACGLPWVGPPVGALAEVALGAHPDPTGICINSSNSIMFAKALEAIMCLPPETRYAWGQNATQLILRDYSLEKQTERLIRILDTQCRLHSHKTC